MVVEVVVASSPLDAGISCWDLHTGAENLRYKSCASPSHGLASVGDRFLASSQIRDPKSSTSGSILYWSWNKPQVELRSFPEEPIKALVSNSQGTYIVGGGISGYIYFWEVATGKLLKKWPAHYRAVTCLVFNDDQSLLISGAEDGCIRVWSIFLIFDDARRQEAKHLYECSFHEHSLRVTDIKIGYGKGNAIIVSASEDRTCKVWSLSKGKLLRDIVFPSMVDAISLGPWEDVLYAGCRDGKIYIAALNVSVTSSNNYGQFIIGSLSEHSKAVTCLASCADGALLVSGSEDGMIRVWDTSTRTPSIIRVLKHTKGPVNNVLVVRLPEQTNPRTSISSLSTPLRRHGVALPPPLEKFANSPDETTHVKAIIGGSQPTSNQHEHENPPYRSVLAMEAFIQQLEKPGTVAGAEVDVERLKSEHQKASELNQQWKKAYENMYQFYVSELLGDMSGSDDQDT